MEIIKRIVGSLPFSAPYLYPFERAVLDSFIEVIPEPLRDLCKKQLSVLNVAQRGGDWEVLLIGRFRFHKARMPRKLLLPVAQGDVILARLTLEAEGQKFNAVLHCQNGALFTVNFGQSYGNVRNSSRIKVAKVSVRSHGHRLMIDTLPSRNVKLLQSLLGKRIVSAKRQLFDSDLRLNDYEQNADGPVEIRFADNSTVHFIADTERLSVGVIAGTMPRYGSSYLPFDASKNFFWSERVGQEVTQISILKSHDWSEDYPSEFGVCFLLGNGKEILIEYLDDEQHPDMTIVAAEYVGAPCIAQILSAAGLA